MNKNIILILIFMFFFKKIFLLNADVEDTYINSTNITYSEKNLIELAENSKINFGKTNILIDKGIIDYNENSFQIFGNFYLYEDLTILSGKNLNGTTNLNSFTAESVSYIYNDDLKIDSDNLKKKDDIVYFYNNFLTPCELDGYFNCPTWSLRIDETKYNVEEDKFTHFDTFLQIADYKIFYVPFFSHYGAKAPRKRGFLTPTIEFTIGGDQGITTPYYIPINQSAEILFKPKIFISENFEFLEKYQVNTVINILGSRGNTSVTVDNIKNHNSENLNTSLKLETKQVINKKRIVSASGLFTNSISTTRSINEQPITFEDIYFRLENYDLLMKNDYFRTSLSSIEAFDSTNFNSIPISPSLNYLNTINRKNFSSINEIEFTILKRNKSTNINPSESFKISLNNEILNNTYFNDTFIYNKFLWSNSLNDYYFNHDTSLNDKAYKSVINISSDLNFKSYGFSTPRVKFILPIQLTNSNKEINEDSNSITFNYHNQFSENRFFGNDVFDTSPRVVFGLENELYIDKKTINFNINQSYETNLNNSYLNEINQKKKFSDYSIEAKIKTKNILFQIDSRLNSNNFSKKEMNYTLGFEDIINLKLNYNETKSDAFKKSSNDTQSIGLNISKKINENINFGYSSSLDIKNNYDPYKSDLAVSIFDECSQLKVSYSNTRFNDNFNTKPSETISLTFMMDYLGFFGYEQSTDLFFKETGKVDYGL